MPDFKGLFQLHNFVLRAIHSAQDLTFGYAVTQPDFHLLCKQLQQSAPEMSPYRAVKQLP